MTKIDPHILNNAISDWETTASIKDILDPIAFRKHMLDKYGIDVGFFMNECRVVDEEKYMMFILRWS